MAINERDNPPKFLVDEMFGNLVRWLRLLGFDTLAATELRSKFSLDIDSFIIHTALIENRVIITGDKQLYLRAKNLGIVVIYISPQTKTEIALKSILNQLNIKDFAIKQKFTRCPICNGKLRPIDKEIIKGRVPPRVYSSIDEFWICEKCGKVYWVGSHMRNIKKTLNFVLGNNNG